jgi:CheY-like chemotaxis protein
MSDCPTTVLLVDDSRTSLAILVAYLDNTGYDLVRARDGVEALRLLALEPDRYQAVLLDLEMPRMSGLEVLQRMKGNPQLMHVPVIIQTASDDPLQVAEGLAAGARYYLIKPLEQMKLQAIIASAIRDYTTHLVLQDELTTTMSSVQLLHNGKFYFQTPHEARQLSTLLAHAYPDPSRVVTGLLELLLNAIEHGNLGITYKEKTHFLTTGQLENETERRLQNPVFRDRVGVAKLTRARDALYLSVIDEGEGFEWQRFLQFSPERAFDTHGRGIATANLYSFDTLEYRGKGNRVETVVRTKPHPIHFRDAA